MLKSSITAVLIAIAILAASSGAMAQSFTALHSFAGETDPFGFFAEHPLGTLIQGIDGSLYGTTYSEYPILYKMAPDGTGYTLLATLGGTPGASDGGVSQGADGTLYGTAVFGGVYGSGVVWKIQPDGSGFTELYVFSGGS